MSDKPVVDTSWELKWKRSLRKRLINCLALIENDGKPTQELQYQLAKAAERNLITSEITLKSYYSDVADVKIDRGVNASSIAVSF